MGYDLSQSPIVIYGLNDFVDDAYLKNYSTYKISEECNKKLAERKRTDPSFNPHAISPSVIKTYIKKKITENELESSPKEIATLNKSVINIHSELEGLVTVLKDEIDKTRSYEGPVLEIRQKHFNDMIKRLQDCIALAANVQGKLVPSININILSTKADKLCEFVNKTEGLDDKFKQLLTQQIITLLMDNLGSGNNDDTIKDVKPVD
jgi:hypothetical protein